MQKHSPGCGITRGPLEKYRGFRQLGKDGRLEIIEPLNVSK